MEKGVWRRVERKVHTEETGINKKGEEKGKRCTERRGEKRKRKNLKRRQMKKKTKNKEMRRK